MHFRFGDAAFDLTTKAIYLVAVSSDEDVAERVGSARTSGADAVLVHGAPSSLASAVASAVGAAPIPVAVRPESQASSAQRSAALAAGATVWFESSLGIDETLLADVATAGASLVVDDVHHDVADREFVRWLASYDLTSERVALTSPTESGRSTVASVARAYAEGFTSVVAPGDGPDRLGRQVAAMMAGARIIETANVREARRVGLTVSELLSRRSVA